MKQWVILCLLALAPLYGASQSLVVGQAEASRCTDQIAAVRREVLNRYSDTLLELQGQFQKAADLEGAVAVRNERQRVEKEQTLTEKDFVQEPKALRAAQQQSLAKMDELTTALVNESLPK